MSENRGAILIGVVGIILVYWAFVIRVRNAFGVNLPSPADLLPQEWRSHLP
jgi:hypothetical protein